MALVGQAELQAPHPWHTASMTSALSFSSPFTFSVFISMATKGQMDSQILHPLHRSLSITAFRGSISISPVESKSIALAAAPLACATVSGISLGTLHEPAKKN